MSKALVYLAGPVSDDPLHHTRKAIYTYTRLIRDAKVTPLLPHLSILADLVSPVPYETWLGYDFEVISRCDALLRLPGDSPGADREVLYAKGLEIPVFETSRCLYDWAEGREIYPTVMHVT